MADPDQQQRIKQLEAKIAAAKKAQEPAPRADEHYSQAQLAWRMVIELVAAPNLAVHLPSAKRCNGLCPTHDFPTDLSNSSACSAGRHLPMIPSAFYLPR